jgi:hypothetical protein
VKTILEGFYESLEAILHLIEGVDLILDIFLKSILFTRLDYKQGCNIYRGINPSKGSATIQIRHGG